MNECLSALTKKDVDYLSGRCIDYKLHDVGYNSDDWRYKLNEPHFIKRGEQYGLSKDKPGKGHSVWVLHWKTTACKR